MQRKLPQNNSSYGQHTHIAERNDRKKIKNKLFFVTLFVVFNLSLMLFLRSSFFTIEKIDIRGLEHVSTEDIKAVIQVQEGMNLWKISPPKLRERALSIPRIKRVDVERVLPSELIIHVEEKHAAALVSYHGYYLELAHDGTFIGLNNDYMGELPLINGLLWGQMDVGTSIPDRTRGEIIDVFLIALEKPNALPLAEINIENPQQITVYTWEGMEVWLGGKEELSKKLDVLESIYSRLLQAGDDLFAGYLDLRVAETPVFRPIEN